MGDSTGYRANVALWFGDVMLLPVTLSLLGTTEDRALSLSDARGTDRMGALANERKTEGGVSPAKFLIICLAKCTNWVILELILWMKLSYFLIIMLWTRPISYFSPPDLLYGHIQREPAVAFTCSIVGLYEKQSSRITLIKVAKLT